MDRRRILHGLLGLVGTSWGGTALAQSLLHQGEGRFVDPRLGALKLSDIMLPGTTMLAQGEKAQQFAAHFDDKVSGLAYLKSEMTLDKDRWGQRHVYLWASEGTISIQQQLVESGLARVDPRSDRRDLIKLLLDAEESARQQKRGLWALPAFRVADAMAANWTVGAFHLVQGKIISATRTRKRLYCNFGEDYRRDFTFTVPMRNAKKWFGTAFEPAAFVGQRWLMRGWVEWINGPSIEALHPDQYQEIPQDHSGISVSQ